MSRKYRLEYSQLTYEEQVLMDKCFKRTIWREYRNQYKNQLSKSIRDRLSVEYPIMQRAQMRIHPDFVIIYVPTSSQIDLNR